jgi:hypothetical protein
MTLSERDFEAMREVLMTPGNPPTCMILSGEALMRIRPDLQLEPKGIYQIVRHGESVTITRHDE